MRILGIISLVFLLLASAACGGGSSSSSTATSGSLSGNWQLNLVQEEPRPQTALSVSGFFQQSDNALTGSVSVPPVSQHSNCGGVSILTGTVSGQSVTLSVNEGGTTLSFTGTISTDNKSMSGDYQGPGGSCFTKPTTGTWEAFLIPPLNGTFTGTLSGSGYLTDLTGMIPPPAIVVSGTMTQSGNIGASNATLTGTINAVGYPCFATASLTGTISGQSVILSVFGYDGTQIGVLGMAEAPAIASSGTSGASLTSGTDNGLVLESSSTTTGPCPALNIGSGIKVTDTTAVDFSFQ